MSTGIQSAKIDAIERSFVASLNDIVRDARLLASYGELRCFVFAPNEENCRVLVDAWRYFSVGKRVYQQVRVIDMDGIEMVRINYLSPTVLGNELMPLRRTMFVIAGLMTVVLALVALYLGRAAAQRQSTQHALRESEERSDLILRSVCEGVYGFDLDGRTTFVNPAASNMLGYSENELLHQINHSLIHHSRPDGSPYPHEDCCMRAAIREGVVQEVKNEVLWRKDGSSFPVEYSSTPIRKGGVIQGAVVVFRDISERKRTEEALRVKSQQIISLMESTTDAYLAMDLEWRITYVNGEAERMLEIAREEAVGQEVWDVVPELASFFYKPFHASMAKQEPQTIEGIYPPLNKWLETHLYPSADGLWMFLRDISERRRAQENLFKLSLAVEQSPASVILTDTSGNIEYVNPKFVDVTGYSPEEVIGKNPRLLKSGETSNEEYKGLWAAVTAGDSWRGEFHNRRKDGTLYWEAAAISAIRMADGTITNFLAVKEDITERKNAEEALRRAHEELEEKVEERTRELGEANEKLKELDRLKSMFIASMSHELRTPLNAIIGFTGIVLDGLAGDINAEQRDQLERVENAGKHLLALISDVIDISKIEAGRVEPYPEAFFLDDVTDEAIATVKAQIKEKGLGLEVTVPEGIRMHTDRRRLLQCILNFVSNAAKYSERGKVRIAVTTRDDEVQIKVTDTGIGISDEDLPRLFRPFERLDSHLRIGTPGTGLGLYLTKKIVATVLDGEVSVKSMPGVGSTFVLKIPKEIHQSEAEDALIE